MNRKRPAMSTTTPIAKGTARASIGDRISAAASAAPVGKMTTHNKVHTKKYPAPTIAISDARRAPAARLTARRYLDNVGTSDGTIIAIIITHHMPRNLAVAPAQDWPGMRIHAIDIVQPPGISMPATSD